MQDAVAEVLRERSAPARGISAPVAVSVLLHGALFAGFVAAANRQAPAPQRTVVQMTLASPQRAAARHTAATPTRETTPAPKAAAPAPEKPQPKPASQPEPAPVAKPPKPTSEGKSLFGRSELEPPTAKRAEGQPSQPAAPPAATRGASPPLPGVGKAGVTALEGGPFPYSLYIDRMVKLIGDRWFRPDSGGEVIAQVYFVINRDGTVRDVKIERSSGVASFDRAAYRAVLEASPLPPLPAAYSGTFLGVHLTFH